MAGRLPPRRARQAVYDLIDIPIAHAQHIHLLPRCWELRDNCTTYDAAYVALAELLEATLVTADGRLASWPGIRCRTEMLGSAGST